MALFQREAGRCHMCGGTVQAGEAWDLSHERPLALGGADDETNWKVAHRKCHREHTAKVDQPAISKAKRREAKHLGAKAPSAKPIVSAGFAKKQRPEKIPLPPRRSMFVGDNQ